MCSIPPRIVAPPRVIERLQWVRDSDPNRRLPSVALPGQSEQPSSSGFKMQTGAPDIKLCTTRDITTDESSAWIPRIEQASKEVANFLRHGSS